MIPNRKKNKYILKRKKHIIKKKEHVREKYLADFSGNRKYLTVISGLVFAVVLRQTGAAQDLGGFHVEMLPGESEEFPSDWETGDGLQDFDEQQQSAENEYEDMFGSGERDWQEDVYKEPESGSGWESSMENTEETDAENLEETMGQNGAEQLQGNLPETGDTNHTGSEDLQEMPLGRIQQPVETVTPTAAVVSGTGASADLYREEKSGKDDMAKAAEKLRNRPYAAPKVFYWKETIKRTGEPVLSIKLSGDIQILSLRINGKETGWKQEKNRIYPELPEERKISEKVLQTELAFLSYSGLETGIYMDVQGKS